MALSMNFDFGTIDAPTLKKLIHKRDGMLKYRICGHFEIHTSGGVFFDDEYFNIFEFVENFGRFDCSTYEYSFTTVDYDEPILELKKNGETFILSSVWADSDVEVAGNEIMHAYESLCGEADRYLTENFGRSLGCVMKLCGQKN